MTLFHTYKANKVKYNTIGGGMYVTAKQQSDTKIEIPLQINNHTFLSPYVNVPELKNIYETIINEYNTPHTHTESI